MLVNDNQVDRIVQLALRVIATITSLDLRLDDFADTLTETRSSIVDAKNVVLRWTWIVTLSTTFLFVWLGAGQWALAHVGWRGLLRRRIDSIEMKYDARYRD